MKTAGQRCLRFPLPSSPLPSSLFPLRIEFGAQLGLRRRALAKQARDDPVAVMPAILDEYLVRVVAGDDDSGDEQSRDRRLQGVGVVNGYSRLRIDRHARLTQQIQARRESGHDVNAIGFHALFVFATIQDDVARLDCLDATLPLYRDLSLLHAIREIRQHPRLDLLFEGRAEMDERYPSYRPPKIERRLCRGIAATHDDNILEKSLVPLAIDVRHVRQLFTRYAEAIGRAEVSGRDDDGSGLRPALLTTRRARYDSEFAAAALNRGDALALTELDAGIRHDGAIVRERITSGRLLCRNNKRKSADRQLFGR